MTHTLNKAASTPALPVLALRALRVLLGLFFVFASVPKLIANSTAVESFDKIGWGDWLMYMVGSLELAGAVALLIPALVGLAGLAFIGLMAGVVVMQLTVLHGDIFTPIGIAVLMGVLAWAYRDRTAALARSLLHRG